MDIDIEGIVGSVVARRPAADDAPAVSAWMLGVLGVLHAPVYRSRELRARMAALGITERMGAYLAQRSAPIGLPAGRPGARLVTATFYGFSPTAVARHVPAVWDAATPAAVLDATFTSLREQLGGLLGAQEDVVVELAGLLGPVAEAHELAGRPLAAAWADVPRPGDPVLDLWLATTVVRESRGDGHLAVLLAEGIGPLESHLVATGDGPQVRETLEAMRGWTGPEFDAVADGLRARGLLDERGGRTDGCRELRRAIERRTDEVSASAWAEAGQTVVTRIGDLALMLLPTMLRSGMLLPPVVQRLAPRA